MSDYFKVRCTGREDGSYDLSYGKGSKKLIGILVKAEDMPGWRYDSVTHKKKRDAITAWEAWAKAKYAGQLPALAPSLGKPGVYNDPVSPVVPRLPEVIDKVRIRIRGMPPTVCAQEILDDGKSVVYRDIGDNEYVRITPMG